MDTCSRACASHPASLLIEKPTDIYNVHPMLGPLSILVSLGSWRLCTQQYSYADATDSDICIRCTFRIMPLKCMRRHRYPPYLCGTYNIYNNESTPFCPSSPPPPLPFPSPYKTRPGDDVVCNVLPPPLFTPCIPDSAVVWLA